MGSQSLEVLVIAVVFSLAVLPALRLSRRVQRLRIPVVAAVVGVVGLGGFAFAGIRLHPALTPEIAVPDRPVQDLRSGYVSSSTCRPCHAEEYASWRASYHSTMTQLATPESIAASFDDVVVELQGTRYELERRGDELWVGMPDPAWTGRGGPPWIERRVVMTTGSHHDQNYWYATPTPGRDLRLLPIDYRISEQKWVPYVSTFLLPPGSRFIYSQSNWTEVCVKCHTTYGERSVDPVTQEVDSRVAEFGIACEACHGPAGEHVALNRDPQHRYRLHLTEEADPSIVNPKKLSGPRSSDVCGQCHGQWVERESGTDLTDSPARFQPGERLEEARIYLQFRNADPKYRDADPQKHLTMKHVLANMPDYVRSRFWPDGQIRVSGREYTGLIDSPCFAGGELSCLSCHTLHRKADDPRPVSEWTNDQLTPGMDGNAACLQCHPQFEGAEALSAHSHHGPESTGSTCYNCHMPFTSYGILKAHRSHKVDSPSVAVSLETGRPNACNACHLDETLAWTAGHLESRYGIPQPALDRDESRIAASILWALRGDAGQRILMAWHMGWQPALAVSGSSWMVPYLAELMRDPYDAVRFVAARSLGRHPGYEDIEYDFVAGPEHLADATARIERRWSQARTELRGATVLQGGDGALQKESWARLRRARDDSPMSITE